MKSILDRIVEELGLSESEAERIEPHVEAGINAAFNATVTDWELHAMLHPDDHEIHASWSKLADHAFSRACTIKREILDALPT